MSRDRISWLKVF